MLLAVFVFGIVFASQRGWPKLFTMLVTLDALIVPLYIWLCWRNRRFYNRLASMSSEEQQSVISKFPGVVRDQINRELNS